MDKLELFNSIAKNYDKINNAISLFTHQSVRKKAINKLSDSHVKILDLCCGTGDIINLIRKKYPNSEITGIDFSENMLDIAKSKFKDINFIKQDISKDKLPFSDNSFDLCTISFGLRNVENMTSVLKEIYRVLEPNGTFFNLDLGKPNKFWNIFLKPFMYIYVPFAGKIANGNNLPLKYFVHSNEKFPHPDDLKKIYEKIGFKQITRKDFLFGQLSCQICKKYN